ncbi:MAG: hypothetical protein AMXMBFR53_16870 [Gemmatimonadota bacterium]
MSPTSRKWLELSARSASAGELEALLAEGLVALGGRAVEEVGGRYVTHVEQPDDPAAFLERGRAALEALVGGAPVDVTWRWIDHQDWAESWKRGLGPRRLTPRLVVAPTWDPVDPRPGDLVLRIDPGMAFGTAEHGTTRGCLRLLDATVAAGERILDVGAGSGILSIAAARMGAGDVLALEGDPLAVEALAENVALNQVTERVRWETRWADAAGLAALAHRDGAVANIESGVLRPLLSGFAAALRPGGWLILSGILEGEWPDMRRDAETAGFHLEAVDEDGEWRSGLFRRG